MFLNDTVQKTHIQFEIKQIIYKQIFMFLLEII